MVKIAGCSLVFFRAQQYGNRNEFILTGPAHLVCWPLRIFFLPKELWIRVNMAKSHPESGHIQYAVLCIYSLYSRAG